MRRWENFALASIGILLLLIGCQTEEDKRTLFDARGCPSFAETKVTNPDGAAPASYVAEVEAAIDQFAAWTGRDAVCVSEVRLEPKVADSDGETYGGMYHSDGWIEIDYTSESTTTVYHEFCHAVDHQEGWISETRPDVFPPEDPRESLAYVCADGPRSLSLADGLEAACGTELGSVLRFINEVVYTAAVVPDNPPEGHLPISLDRRAVQGMPEDWRLELECESGRLLRVSGRDGRRHYE